MGTKTLVSPEQHWLLWAILIAVATFGIWSEKTKWGSKLSGAVVSIIGSFILSNLSIIPTVSPTYDIVWSYLVPLAIPMLLFKANIKRIVKESGPTLIAFFLGAIGTIVGTIIAFSLLNLGVHNWQLAAIFSATYIGGSMNYVAASQAVQLNSPEILTAGVAADNLVMALYFLILFAIPSFKFFQKKYKTKHLENAEGPTEDFNLVEPGNNSTDLINIAKTFSIASGICALGFLAQDGLQLMGIHHFVEGSAILIITAITVLIATLFHKSVSKIKGADQIGTFLMQIFFAAIGASANIGVVLSYGPILFVFAGLILLIHLIFILISGKLLNLDLAEILIASNANMGGPTTAAAMAVGRKWNALVLPAILCGTLGYAIATFIGVGLGFWLKTL
ncbi:DUF819 domain-containing protein [Melioribacteraceae bacterium 4301-Me]|uniref:DUF819 family protein n=1 Tax=Pyranulibacter aquaticus TaxID=3163344 RepID=UPI003595388A